MKLSWDFFYIQKAHYLESKNTNAEAMSNFQDTCILQNSNYSWSPIVQTVKHADFHTVTPHKTA